MNQLTPDSYHDLIIKRLTGEASEQELARLTRWLDESSSNRRVFDEYRKTWSALGKVKGKTAVDVEADWQALEARLDEPFLQTEEVPAYRQTASRAGWLKVAAALLLLVFSAAALLLNWDRLTYERLATGQAEVKQLALADGSQVTLNAQSVLLYPETFDAEVRQVKLEGEAFFEVAHNPQQPFLVALDGLLVRVIGTSFNIEAYSKGGSTRVSVQSGKVAVYPEGQEKEQVLLTAGQAVVFNTTSQQLRTEAEANPNLLAWKTQALVFNDTPLEEVIRQISKAYHVPIHIRNVQLRHCPVSVKFEQQSLEAVLNVLESTLDLRIEQTDTQVEIDGEAC